MRNEITLPTKLGETVFYINDVDPFRVQGVLNEVAKLLDINLVAGLMGVVQMGANGKPVINMATIAKVLPTILGLIKGADTATLTKLVDFLLCEKACKYRVVKVEGYKDFEMGSVATLFTGKFISLYKLLGFSFEVNFRPLVDELLASLPKSEEAPAETNPNP